jgi:hypothetical protein
MTDPAIPVIPVPAKPSLRERLFSAATLKALAAVAVIAAASTFAAWRIWLKPQREIARMRYETSNDVLQLYALQQRYATAKGTYASDLDSLLALTPDPAARKRMMGEHLDLATLTVVGDARKFKIEANVLDAERTLVKIRGPITDKPAPRPEMVAPQETIIGLGSDGRPLTNAHPAHGF